mgnify:CR=1 FL=1
MPSNYKLLLSLVSFPAREEAFHIFYPFYGAPFGSWLGGKEENHETATEKVYRK